MKGMYVLNRKKYQQIRKMDHGQMSLFVENVYKEGFKDGKEAAEGLTIDEVREVLLSVKGIGEKKAADIVAVLTERMEGNVGVENPQ